MPFADFEAGERCVWENPMDAYIYKAALYCSDCAATIRQGLNFLCRPRVMQEDSEYVPQGPYANRGGGAEIGRASCRERV